MSSTTILIIGGFLAGVAVGLLVGLTNRRRPAPAARSELPTRPAHLTESPGARVYRLQREVDRLTGLVEQLASEKRAVSPDSQTKRIRELIERAAKADRDAEAAERSVAPTAQALNRLRAQLSEIASRMDKQAASIQADAKAPSGAFDVGLAAGLKWGTAILAEFSAELRRLS